MDSSPQSWKETEEPTFGDFLELVSQCDSGPVRGVCSTQKKVAAQEFAKTISFCSCFERAPLQAAPQLSQNQHRLQPLRARPQPATPLFQQPAKPHPTSK